MCPEGGPVAQRHDSRWRRRTLGLGAAEVCVCPEGLQGAPKPQAQPALAWRVPWWKPLNPDYSRPLLPQQVMVCPLAHLPGHLECLETFCGYEGVALGV